MILFNNFSIFSDMQLFINLNRKLNNIIKLIIWNMFTRSTGSGASTNPFGGGSKPNAFGAGSTTTQTQNPLASFGYGSAESNNIMYLSSNNPNRHTKLSTFPENIKKGFYFIENKFENNDRYLEAFAKGRINWLNNKF